MATRTQFLDSITAGFVAVATKRNSDFAIATAPRLNLVSRLRVISKDAIKEFPEPALSGWGFKLVGSGGTESVQIAVGPLKTNTMYSFSFMARRTAGSGSVPLSVDLHPDTLPETAIDIQSPVWTRYTWNGITSASADMTGNVELRIFRGTLPVGVDYEFEGIKLEEGPVATAWSPSLVETKKVNLQDTALSAIEVSPEDFYRATDGDNWSPALVRLETFRRAFPNNDGSRLIKVTLRKRQYLVKTAVEFLVGVNNSLNLEGAGYILDGGRLVAHPTGWLSGATPVLTIRGDAGPDTTGQVNISNFAITQGSQLSDTGLMIKDLKASAGHNTVLGVYVDGFKYGVQYQDARMFWFEGVYAWCRNVANAVGFRLISDGSGSFTGDCTFVGCQSVVGNSTEGVPVYTGSGSEPVTLEAYNGGSTRGIRFMGFIGYHGDHGVKVYAGPGSEVADWWFMQGCQFDQIVIAPWDIQTGVSGSSHGSVHTFGFDGCYWTTILSDAHSTALCGGTRNSADQINVNSGLIAEGKFINCMIANFSKNLFFEKCVGITVENNDTYGWGQPGVPLDSIWVASNCHNMKFDGNCARASANNITYALIVSGGSNITATNFLGQIKAVRDFDGVVTNELWGQVSFKKVSVFADNAAAVAGGLPVGAVYRTSTGVLMIVY